MVKWTDETETLMRVVERDQCQHERRGYVEANSGPGWTVCLDCGYVFPPHEPHGA
jgi:hypothetical protein